MRSVFLSVRRSPPRCPVLPISEGRLIVVVPGPFGPIETRSRPLWTIARLLHAYVVTFMRLCWCFVRDTDGSIPSVASIAEVRSGLCTGAMRSCQSVDICGQLARMRLSAPTARLRDTTEDVMTDDRVPRSSQEVDRCATRRRDPQAEGRRRRRRASSRHVHVQGDPTRR